MKRKIITNKEKLTPEDIAKGKDFGELMKAYQAAPTGTSSGISGEALSKPFYKSGWFTGGMATLGVAAVITVGTILLKDNNNSSKQVGESEIALLADSTKSFVNPPVKEVDIPKNNYVIDANIGGKINHFTGTKITIPANAFVYEDGTPVKGEVDIEYREFHDQVDIYFSGIPMEYDSAGKKSIFESAGMMEIRAFQNGKKLEVAPNKSFEVCMHTKNPDPKFNLYYLDETKKKWDYIGKDSVHVEQPEMAQTLGTAVEPQIVESDKEILTPEIKKQIAVVEEIKKDIKQIEKTEPAKPSKVNEEKYSFNIDVMETEFPEITTYKGTVFEAIDQQNFDASVYDVEWEDVQLKKQDKNGQYNVILSKGETKKEILVKPVFEGKNYEKALADFNKNYKSYEKRLTKRKADEKREAEKLQKQRESYLASLTNEQKERLNLAEKTAKADAVMNRIFKVTRVGTWNCDSPVPLPIGAHVMAFFEDAETGETIIPKSLRLIQKGMNAVFPLNSNLVRFNPKRDNIIWGIDKDENLVYAFNDQFLSIQEGQDKNVFKMKKIDPSKQSLKEIKNILGC